MITKEPNSTPFVLVDSDWENRILDHAIAALEDVAECDGSCVMIRWISVSEFLQGRIAAGGTGPKIPLLYVLFSDAVAQRGELPRVHLDGNGKLWPVHAVCLAKLPSLHLLEGDAARRVIRKGVEAFSLQHNVTRVTHATTGESLHA